MLIDVLCRTVCGLPAELVTGRILPGAALSILAGNLFYAWQARRLMRETGRSDVTALPYGINTVSLLAFVFLIMAPVYRETGDPNLAWQVGLFACFLSAVMEIAGAFAGDWLRRHTPRAALLCALSGIALTFISMGFVFQIFSSPAVAIVPMMIILIAYASRAKMPLGLPGGLVAVLTGTVLAWGLRSFGLFPMPPAAENVKLGFHFPVPALSNFFALMTDPRGWRYMSVIFPMGLFNVIGSLQNLESAEAAGDRFDTKSSLLANGLGGLSAALFGSPFPTTIYIGHPAWKAMGARAGYSVMNGAAITLLCLTGAVGLVLKVIPLEATLGILLWIGISITSQAFKDVPRHHTLGVAFGLIPCLAAWALLLVDVSVRKAGGTLYDVAPSFGGDLYIHGVISLNQGFLLTSMIFAAVMVHLLEKKLLLAAAWTAVAAALSAVGLIHAYTLTPLGVENKFGLLAAPDFALAYAAVALLLVLMHATGRGEVVY